MTTFQPKRLEIIYSTQTGTSEDAAYSYYRRIKPWSTVTAFEISVINSSSIPNFSYFLQNHENVDVIYLFLLSTTGDGEVPNSFKGLWGSLLRKNLSPSLFEGLRFCVFGFGDSSYQKFNACARKFFVRMTQLGAEAFLDLCLGDDQAPFGYFSVFNGFLEDLTTKLQSIGFPFTLNPQPLFNEDLYSINLLEKRALKTMERRSDVIKCKVVRNDRLTAEDWAQDVRLITFEIDSLREDHRFYESGDVAVVFYKNDLDLVGRAVRYFSSSLPVQSFNDATDVQLSIIRLSSSALPSFSIPSLQGVTLLELFESYLEIGAVPKPSFFSLLAQNTSNLEEKEKLLELSSPTSIDLYFQYCLKERRNFIDILEEFPHVLINLPLFLEVCPQRIPRKYSIASFPSSSRIISCKPNQLDLCVAVVEYITPYKRTRFGLCSKYLSQLIPHLDTCSIKIEKGIISESKIKEKWFKSHQPLICIGPGTGVAPIRSIIQEFFGSQSSFVTSAHSNSHLLIAFFGCRKPNKDSLFVEEWKTLEQNFPFRNGAESCSAHSAQFLFRIAYSQEFAIKQYVTHLMRENSAAVWSLLQQGASIFVSGSGKRMPQDVKKAFLNILKTEGSMSEEDANRFLQTKIARKEYVVDAW